MDKNTIYWGLGLATICGFIWYDHKHQITGLADTEETPDQETKENLGDPYLVAKDLKSLETMRKMMAANQRLRIEKKANWADKMRKNNERIRKILEKYDK